MRAWSLRPDGEVRNIGTSFLHHYEGGDLHLTAFAEDAITTVVPSLVPSSTPGPRRPVVVPEWTIDLIHCQQAQRFASAVQMDRPGSRSHAKFEFEAGELVSWQMDPARVDSVIDKMNENIKLGNEFTLGPFQTHR
jgi:hypothetical protein